MTLMDRLVGEHGLAHDVADCKNMRLLGAHLAVDRNEATVIGLNAGSLSADGLAIWPATNSLQDQVVALGRGRCIGALEGHIYAIGLGRCPNGLGL